MRRVMMRNAMLTFCIAALAACDGFKQLDANVGLLTTFNVDTIERDGRQLIRMHSRSALAIVDPVGGHIVDYHRHTRRGAFYSEAPAGESDDAAKTPAEAPADRYDAQPNVLAHGPWRLSIAPGGRELDARRDWMVDADTIQLVLLSDTVAGLRIRRTYTLYDNGVLDIDVSIFNDTGRSIKRTIESLIDGVETFERSEPLTEHVRIGDQWLSRRLTGGLHTITESQSITPFRFADYMIPARRRLRWSERWWITSAEGEYRDRPPAEPPKFVTGG